ncbi:hypothetical protein VZT92_020935 [Zoarces viviparus]|uniref:Uncharacterized protein n=1 Tax=Zoarces viviparus TaxID=48416 RepID=A0AAW1EF21_ZOAVI
MEGTEPAGSSVMSKLVAGELPSCRPTTLNTKRSEAFCSMAQRLQRQANTDWTSPAEAASQVDGPTGGSSQSGSRYTD